jgi:hypothetical protein
MTVAQLIELLKKMPQDATVFYEGGDYADDWRRVSAVNNLNAWGTRGVLIE